MGFARFLGVVVKNQAKEEPPGPLAQSLNDTIHRQPFALLADGVFWVWFLLVVAPFAATIHMVMTFVRLVLYCAGWSSERVSTTKDDDDELAVVVTGCDSGFGKDLAVQLATNGFRVFAGCLRKDSFEQYKGKSQKKP